MELKAQFTGGVAELERAEIQTAGPLELKAQFSGRVAEASTPCSNAKRAFAQPLPPPPPVPITVSFSVLAIAVMLGIGMLALPQDT